jgi:monoamine oxidase
MMQGQPGKGTPVAILGGGVAGLNAARLLHRAGIPFHLFEARDRLGGRVLTLGETGAPEDDGFDLGPAWFWPQMQRQLADLVAELGLATLPQHSAGDMLFEHGPNAPPQRVRAPWADQGSMRLVGGTAALVRALARGLPDGCLSLATEVTGLTRGDAGVRLTLASKKPPADPVVVRHVIATLPPRLMASAVRLDPAPPEATLDLWRSTPTWMATQAKIVAVYPTAFWRAAGLSGMAQSRVGPLAEIHDASTASGKAALFGFVGLTAQARRTLSREAVTRAAVLQLERLFGPQAAQPQAILLHDWADDRFTATEADLHSAGHPQATQAAWVSGPWSDRLTMAGSETSLTEPGYLAGAIEASGRAAQDWMRSDALRVDDADSPSY